MSTSHDHPGTSQKVQVLHPGDLPSKNRGGGCQTIPLVTWSRGATTFLNGTTSFDPGAQIAHHQHNVVESVMVVEGRAIVDVDGVRTELETFDTTLVPANIDHHFENASSTEPMRIFWTYASTDATRTLAATGEKGRIDDESSPTSPGPRSDTAVIERVALVAKPGDEKGLEQAVQEAVPVFQKATGARVLELFASVEEPGRYEMSILWETLENHLEDFLNSEGFTQWREIISPHLDMPPRAHHERRVLVGF